MSSSIDYSRSDVTVTCLSCRRSIPDSRLRAVPTAVRCMPCQTAWEVSPAMPFGKHFGKRLTDIRSGYLSWLLSLGDELHEPLRSCVLAEVGRRALDKTRGRYSAPAVTSAFEPAHTPRYNDVSETSFYPTTQRRARRTSRTVPVNPVLETAKAARAERVAA